METGVGEDVLGNYTRVVSQLGRGEGTCVCVCMPHLPTESPEESNPRFVSCSGIDSRAAENRRYTLSSNLLHK